MISEALRGMLSGAHHLVFRLGYTSCQTNLSKQTSTKLWLLLSFTMLPPLLTSLLEFDCNKMMINDIAIARGSAISPEAPAHLPAARFAMQCLFTE